MTMVDTVAALTRPLVERLSNRLGGPVWNRRNFLVRTALFGSAVAIAPKEFALEPRTAYQSVCGLSTKCHDGYTAFCCTINNGANFCPTGTFISGWWKADRASFCGGKARYYVDCNGLPHTEWHCHCPSTTTCDKRHVSCVQFRYGNCHTEIAIDVRKSPVVCRLVTCTPPWQFDPSCTKASFTDQETVTHSAPCLPGPNPSAITNKWSDLGGKGGELGPRLAACKQPHFSAIPGNAMPAAQSFKSKVLASTGCDLECGTALAQPLRRASGDIRQKTATQARTTSVGARYFSRRRAPSSPPVPS